MRPITSEIRIRPIISDDWDAVANIYEEGINTGFATFETQVPTYHAWDSAHLKSCRIIASYRNSILGWSALSPVSRRRVYSGVAEVSVYVGKNDRGKGVGLLLMQTLISQSEKQGLWTLQSSIFPENIGSIRLHEKTGFRYIGKRVKVSKLNGIWKDNLLFERRSMSIGVN